MKKKILFITDSLAFPRSVPETVNYEETYISKLKNDFSDSLEFIHVGFSGATTGDFMKALVNYWDTLKPDIIVFHCGIVDCAPRALTKVEGQIVRRIPVFNKLLGKIIKKNSTFLRKKRNITYTSPSEFNAHLTQILNHFNPSKSIIIEIAPVPESYDLKVPGMRRNQAEYNTILNKLGATNITSANIKESDLMSDFHHINKNGHKKVYVSLKEILNNLH